MKFQTIRLWVSCPIFLADMRLDSWKWLFSLRGPLLQISLSVKWLHVNFSGAFGLLSVWNVTFLGHPTRVSPSEGKGKSIRGQRSSAWFMRSSRLKDSRMRVLKAHSPLSSWALNWNLYVLGLILVFGSVGNRNWKF